MPTRIAFSRGVLATLALASVLAGCGSSNSSSSSSGASSSSQSSSAPRSAAAPAAVLTKATKVSVAIANYAFKPADLTVKVGTKLTFTNHDATAHTASTKTPGFDTGTLNPGHSATVTVSKPGTYSYYCQFHAFMVAKVTVVS